MVEHKFKKAFSIAEILISMFILGVFFVVTAKTITIKQKNEIMRKVHGHFECYYKGNTLYYARSRTGERTTLKKAGGNSCTFIPATNSSLFQFTVLYPKNSQTFNTYDSQQFINTASITIVPPRTLGSSATIGTDSIKPDDKNINEEVSYQIVRNNLEITSSKSNIVQDLKNGSVGGAIIISW